MIKRSFVFWYGFDVKLVEGGEIGDMEADALVAPIDQFGIQCYGCLDGVIKSFAQEQYHAQVRRPKAYCHAETRIAVRKNPHKGKFRDVIFVIDNLNGGTHDMVVAMLAAANAARYAKIAMLAFRTGRALGNGVQDDYVKSSRDTQRALSRFEMICSHPSIKELTIIVRVDKDSVERDAYNTIQADLQGNHHWEGS